MGIKKNHTNEYKAKVVLAALSGFNSRADTSGMTLNLIVSSAGGFLFPTSVSGNDKRPALIPRARNGANGKVRSDGLRPTRAPLKGATPRSKPGGRKTPTTRGGGGRAAARYKTRSGGK